MIHSSAILIRPPSLLNGVFSSNASSASILNVVRTYAKAAPRGGKKVVGGKDKFEKYEFESNTKKLAEYACIDYFIPKKGANVLPGPKILADKYYPDWLFKLKTEPNKQLEDLDPEKDGWAYWRALQKRQLAEKQFKSKLKYRYLLLQDSPSKKKYNPYDKFGNFM